VWECKRKGEKNFRKKLSKLKFRACSGSSWNCTRIRENLTWRLTASN
jgi:hypothetical protein